MASANFNPTEVYCSQWKKINTDYTLRPLSTKENDKCDNKKVSSPTRAVCSECHNPGNLRRCGGCYEVAYCCNDHQKIHWKEEHRLKCCPYKIVQGDPKTVGRYVIATR